MSWMQKVRVAKCLSAPRWHNVLLPNCRGGKMSGWQNVGVAKCLGGKMSGCRMSGNPSGSALGISLGLRRYFIVYPSSRHNTVTICQLVPGFTIALCRSQKRENPVSHLFLASFNGLDKKEITNSKGTTLYNGELLQGTVVMLATMFGMFKHA